MVYKITTLSLGQSVTNNTRSDMEVHVKYLNCFDLWQTDVRVLKPGETFTKTQVSTTVKLRERL